MKKHYADEELPPMDFWDLVVVRYGEFVRATLKRPEGVYIPIEFPEVPEGTRASVSAVAKRAGYPGPPDCVFVRHQGSTAQIFSGWLKP